MKIIAAADIHFPRYGLAWTEAMAVQMCNCGADVLILAGDITTGDATQFNQILGVFKNFKGPRLFIPGNHDLWVDDEDPDTSTLYYSTLQTIITDAGFHYLPGAPYIVGKIGFVGSLGWYDYSMRQIQTPYAGLHVTPLKAKRTADTTQITPLTETPIAWENLTTEHYKGKALMWHEDDKLQNIVWNDALYMDWKITDEAVTAQMLADIAIDLKALPEAVNQVVAVTHHVPHESLLKSHRDKVGAAFSKAYLGANSLASALEADPRMRLVLYGHSHHQNTMGRNGILYANCSVADNAGSPRLFEITEETT